MNIIVSGASQGIGYETAIKFADKGYSVLAIARNKEKLLELSNSNARITALALDLTKEGIGENIRKVWRGEKVDAIVNNAGALINKPFLTTNLEDFRKQFDSNVITAVNLLQSTSNMLSEGAHVVNISSMGGFQGSSKFPGLSAYSTAKGALSILTECLAEELKGNKVYVNALALGAVQTEMLEKAFPNYLAPLSATEMAEYIVEFTSNGHRYYNGKVLPVALNNP